MKRAVPRVMQKVEASGAMRWLASLFKVRSFPDPSINSLFAPKNSLLGSKNSLFRCVGNLAASH
jgi:hypothetical protein